MNSTNPKVSPVVLWLVLIIVFIFGALFSAEILVRLIPGKWSSGFFHRFDPELGTWHIENVKGNYIQEDYIIKNIKINSFGMRDYERSLEKKDGVTRIAILGDSFIEGMQVNIEETFSSQLENLLGDKFEVLNFGVGGFGTTQSYLTYKNKVKSFKPDIVILAFLSSNDMRNNSKELETLYNGGERNMPFLEKKEGGSWVITPVKNKIGAQNPITLFLKSNFTLYRFAWFEWQYLSNKFRSVENASPEITENRDSNEKIDTYLARLFTPPETQSEVFQKAWGATDKLIEMLDKEVRAEGATFVLISLPSSLHIEPDPQKSFEKAFDSPSPKGFDVDYPEKHLSLLSESIDLPYLNLTPIFRDYKDKNKLESPYFSFEHDGHWSVLGHKVAAESMEIFLKESNMIKGL